MSTCVPSRRRVLRVAFRHFYPGFQPTDFFVPLLEQTFSVTVRIVHPRRASLVFTSVYESFYDIWKRRLVTRGTSPAVPAPPKKVSDQAKQVWITGENIRVPIFDYDLSISFDTDPYGGKNLYWPYIFENLDWGLKESIGSTPIMNSRGVPLLPPRILASTRDHQAADRQGFVCAFVGNPEPVRLRAIEELRRYGVVDVYGSSFNRSVVNKSHTARNYKFMLAFENDVYPGYVTEKPLEAYVSGCIPLWRGIDSQNLLNSKACVNALNFSNLSGFARAVHELSLDRDRMNETSSAELFNQAPTLDPLKKSLRALLMDLDPQLRIG